jgi:hypothetical protein
MKKLFITAITLCLIINASAQSAKYPDAMKKTLSVLDSAMKTFNTDELQNAANGFERIANAEKDQWLPYYYAAYTLTMKAFGTRDKSAIDAIADKADQYLSMAESFSQNNSEITTVKAMVLQARLSVDASRGMTMGPKSSELLQTATKQEPANNPRALLQLSQTVYYTPTAFGGGKDAGLAILKKAIDAFASFKPASDLDPNWGKEYADGLLAQWSTK